MHAYIGAGARLYDVAGILCLSAGTNVLTAAVGSAGSWDRTIAGGCFVAAGVLLFYCANDVGIFFESARRVLNNEWPRPGRTVRELATDMALAGPRMRRFGDYARIVLALAMICAAFLLL